MITDADVDDAFARVRRRIRVANLASLPFHHHALYELIRQHGSIKATDLYDRYDDVVDAEVQELATETTVTVRHGSQE